MLSKEQWQTILAAIYIAILVVIASLAAWPGTQTVSLAPTVSTNAPKPSENTIAKNNPDNGPQSNPIIIFGDFVRGYKDEITAISTALLAIITGVLVIIARGQYITTQRQLRAYVTGGPRFLYSFTATSNVRCEIYLRNDGVTPAFNMRQRVAIDVFPESLPDDFRFPDILLGWSAFIVVFPRDTFQGTVSRGNFSEDDIAAIVAGEKRIYIWGEIIYDDTFGQHHFTKFYSRVGYDLELLKKLSSDYQPTDLKIIFESAGRMQAN
jgi:hypothetical protein